MKRKFDWVIGDRKFFFYVIVSDEGGKIVYVNVDINVISVYDFSLKFVLEKY